MGAGSPLNAVQHSPVKLSGPGLLCVGSFLIAVSISSGVLVHSGFLILIH